MPEPAPEEAPSAPEMPVVEVFPVGDGVLVPAPEGVAEPPVEAAGEVAGVPSDPGTELLGEPPEGIPGPDVDAPPPPAVWLKPAGVIAACPGPVVTPAGSDTPEPPPSPT